MRELIKKIMKAARTTNLQLAIGLNCAGNTRKARNIGHLMASPVMTEAAMANIIGDHLVVENLMHLDETARNIVVRLETKLGRKIGRDRIKALLAALARVRAAKTTTSATVIYLSAKNPTRKAA